MAARLDRSPKSIQGNRLKNQIIKLTDEHSRTVPHNPEKARAVMERLKLVKRKFRFHEGIADAQAEIREIQSEIAELVRPTKTERKAGQPAVITRKSKQKMESDLRQANQLRLLVSGKKQFVKTLEQKLKTLE